MRKGVSEILSAVLVLAVGVSVAGVFSGWLPGFAEDSTSDAVEAQEKDLKCSNAAFRILENNYNGFDQFTSLKIENSGRIRFSNGMKASAVKNSNILNQTEIDFLGVDGERRITLDTEEKPDTVLTTVSGCTDLGKKRKPETLDIVVQGSQTNGHVQVWMPSEVEGLWVNKSSNGLKMNYTGHTTRVLEVSSFPDGRIVSSSRDVHIWNPLDSTDKLLSSPGIEYTGTPNQVLKNTVLGDGRLASSTLDGNDNALVHVWDPSDATGGTVSSPDVNYSGHGGYSPFLTSPVHSYQSNKVISGGYPDVHIWDPDDSGNNKQLSTPDKKYTGHSGLIVRIEMLENGKVLSASSEVHIWDPAKTTPISTPDTKYTGHSGSVFSLEELEDGRIASGSNNNQVHIWDPDEGSTVNNPEVKYTGHGDSVTGLLELSDGRIASSCGSCGEIHVWEPEKGTLGREDAEIIYNIQKGPTGIINIGKDLE